LLRKQRKTLGGYFFAAPCILHASWRTHRIATTADTFGSIKAIRTCNYC